MLFITLKHFQNGPCFVNEIFARRGTAHVGIVFDVTVIYITIRFEECGRMYSTCSKSKAIESDDDYSDGSCIHIYLCN